MRSLRFSPLEVERYGVISGKDYAIQLDGSSDNESTFKRVFFDPKDESVLVLKCVNPRSKSPGKVKRRKGDSARASDLGVASAGEGDAVTVR